ncbi:MAG: hypothetical protein K2X07_08260 [Caulobacteraceae bacterium]|nr:hypothetical protein [Caulobacteraceae bacterium]
MRYLLLSLGFFLVAAQVGCAQDRVSGEARAYLDALPRSFENFGGATAPERLTVDSDYDCGGGQHRFAFTEDARGVTATAVRTPWGTTPREDIEQLSEALRSLRSVSGTTIKCDAEARTQVIWLYGPSSSALGEQVNLLFWFEGPRLSRIQRP